MIIFPKNISSASRYILTFYLENGKNKKIAAHLAGVTLRTAQRAVRKHAEWLNGYKEL